MTDRTQANRVQANRMEPNRIVAAFSWSAEREPVGGDHVIEGAPATGHVVLDETTARTIGLWDHTPGVSRDVEDDEVFVVLEGDATLAFEGSPAAPLELTPGAVVRLEKGAKTIWTVRETLRKLYISP